MKNDMHSSIFTLLLTGCSFCFSGAYAQDLWTADDFTEQRDHIENLLAEHRIPAVGIGVIRDGEVLYTGVYGESRPGVPAPDDAVFSVASLTKPIVSLLTLRLISDGAWELDEPLARYWVDPDLAGDPLLPQLTTRHVLRHQTGFKNWRQMNESGKLQFDFPPGERVQYSGEGFEYLQRALERKFDRPLAYLVDSAIFRPLGITDAGFTWYDLADTSRFAYRYDVTGGTRYDRYRIDNVSAAGSLTISAGAYLRFAQSVLRSEGLSPAVAREMVAARVPTQPGLSMGLGWEIAPDLNETGAYALIHTGGDRGIKTVVILLPASQEALVLFTNGDNGMELLPHLVRRCLSLGAELLERGQEE